MPSKTGNADVDDCDVGALARDRFPARQAVGGFAGNVERGLERGPQAGARKRVIFDDDDADAAFVP